MTVFVIPKNIFQKYKKMYYNLFMNSLSIHFSSLLRKIFFHFSAFMVFGLMHFAWSAPKCNNYVCFDVPKNWKCVDEGVHRICHNKLRPLAKEAIIIVVAKEAGKQDGVTQYINYLKEKKNYKTRKGKPMTSKVYHSRSNKIKNHLWADGFHLASEIPVYYTRYLGSTKGGLAVLVTYTAHRKLWKKYAADFNRSILSLRLLNVEEAIRKLRAMKKHQIGGRSIRDYLEDIIGDGDIDGGGDDGGGDWIQNNWDKIAGGAVGAGVIGTLLWRLARKRRTGGSPVQRSSSSAVSSRRRRRRN